jgi:hypothetical protein
MLKGLALKVGVVEANLSNRIILVSPGKGEWN